MSNLNDKTNVCRILDGKKVAYIHHAFDTDVTNGMELAGLLGQDYSFVFKTLVTRGKSGNYFVFVIPVDKELDLKNAAKAVAEKNIEMIAQKELLPLTGYVHGGCSPIGMKKYFKTVIDISAEDKEKIFFSAGKIGHQIEMSPKDISKVIRVDFADLTV